MVGSALLCGFLPGVASAAVALAPPGSLTATAVSSSGVALRWSDANSTEKGYVVERSLRPDGGFKRIKILAPNTVGYSDGALAASTTYHYRVTTKGTARRSNVASATTLAGGALPTPVPTATPRPTSTATGDAVPPSVPGHLSGSAPSCAQVNLSWSPSVDTGGSGLKGYRVYRNGTNTAYVGAPAASTSDSTVSGGAVYSYSVVAVDGAGNQSGTSATLALNTPQCPSNDGPWAQRFGGSSGDQVLGVATDAAGNIVVVGSFRSTANFGGANLVSPGGMDVFIAKYSASGAHLWSKRFGGSGDELAQTVAIDRSGAIVVGGYFASASIDLGGGAHANAAPGVWDGFVAKYSSTGQYLWSSTFGGVNQDSVEGLAVDSSGDVVATGLFKGTNIDFAGRALSSTWGGPDTFIVKLSGVDGASIWAKNINCGGPDLGSGVAIDQDDSIFVAGQFFGTADFGGGALTTAGMNDVYLAKYSPSGGFVWAKRFGAANDDLAASVAVDGGGNVAITGVFYGSVAFGGATLRNPSNVMSDVFVAKFTGNGAHIWSKSFGGDYADYGVAIAADLDGNVLVTGTFNGTVSFGGAALTSASTATSDIFVAEYSPTGAHLFSARYGSAGSEIASAAAFGPNGGLVGGAFTGTMAFDGTNLVSAGMGDGFLFDLGQ
jgi:hypothetical protein